MSDSRAAHVEFVPWVFNFRDWVEERANPKWTQQVAKYHHYRFRKVPEATFITAGVDVPLYCARCQMKEWDLDGLEWYPPPLIDKKTREGTEKVQCYGLRVLPSQDFDLFREVGAAPFEGKGQKKELEAVVNMVARLAAANRAGWDCPKDLPIYECPVVKHWSQLAISLPFSIGAGSMWCNELLLLVK